MCLWTHRQKQPLLNKPPKYNISNIIPVKISCNRKKVISTTIKSMSLFRSWRNSATLSEAVLRNASEENPSPCCTCLWNALEDYFFFENLGNDKEMTLWWYMNHFVFFFFFFLHCENMGYKELTNNCDNKDNDGELVQFTWRFWSNCLRILIIFSAVEVADCITEYSSMICFVYVFENDRKTDMEKQISIKFEKKTKTKTKTQYQLQQIFDMFNNDRTFVFWIKWINWITFYLLLVTSIRAIRWRKSVRWLMEFSSFFLSFFWVCIFVWNKAYNYDIDKIL